MVTISYIFSIYLSLQLTKNNQILDFATSEEEIGHPFMIPEDIAIDEETLYSVLKKSAIDANVNVFRSARYHRPDEKIEYIKYLLLTGESKLFNYVQLKEGKFPNSDDADYILTSSIQDHKKRIGVLKELSSELHTTIRPLEDSFAVLSSSGRYFIETDDNENVSRFLDTITTHLNTYIMNDTNRENNLIVSSDLQPNQAFISYNNEMIILHDLSLLETSRNIILAITCLLFIYYLFSQTKPLGVMKMHGVSIGGIWWRLIGKLIVYTFIATMLGFIIFAFLSKLPLTDWFISLISLVALSLLYIIASIISLIILSKFTISDMVKKKKSTKPILIINWIAKVIIGISIIFISLDLFFHYNILKEDINRFQEVSEQGKEWKKVADKYGVFQSYIGYSTAHNYEELENELQKEDASLNRLYKKLNEMGSMVIDASEYEQQNLALNQGSSGISSMIVNVNYLSAYPLLDSNGNPLHITENEKDWLILVPEQYKHEEEEIINYFKSTSDFYLPTDKDSDIQLLWIKSGQRAFSMNPHVFPLEDNYVQDPVIHVKTTSNDLNLYRGGIRGNGLGDPMKVALLNGNPQATFQELFPLLESLNLSLNSKISSIDNFITERIMSQKSYLRYNVVALVCLFLLFTIVSIQNLVIQFHNQSKKFVLYSLFGISITRSYLPTITRVVITYFMIVSLAVFANHKRLLTSDNLIPSLLDSTFLWIIFIILLIELTTTIISLVVIEKRNKITIIKSGL